MILNARSIAGWLMKRYFAWLILSIGMGTGISAAASESKIVPRVIRRIVVSVHPSDGAPSERFLDPPFPIYEGLNGEIIAHRGCFLEIFSKEGKFIRRVGGKGEGPGEFSVIVQLRIFDQKYFVLGFPNQLNVFDRDFRFIKRIPLIYEGGAAFVVDFDIGNSGIVAVQRRPRETRWGGKGGNDEVLSLYSRDGLFKTALFLKESFLISIRMRVFSEEKFFSIKISSILLSIPLIKSGSLT